MTVTCVYVNVKEEKVDAFINACIENHNQSIKENGNLRFDVIQDENNPTSFMLYEAYESEAAAAAHKETEHYFKWRETVADWMATPRKGVKHKVLALQK